MNKQKEWICVLLIVVGVLLLGYSQTLAAESRFLPMLIGASCAGSGFGQALKLWRKGS